MLSIHVKKISIYENFLKIQPCCKFNFPNFLYYGKSKSILNFIDIDTNLTGQFLETKYIL